MKSTTLDEALSRRDEPAADATGSLAGKELAREMRRCWRRGDRHPAEVFLNRHPELWLTPESALDLIYEEYCLREAAGDTAAEQDLTGRFPQWAGPLRVMLDCHRVLKSGRDEPQYPAVGKIVGEFRLLDELGRGSRGRVFLATQTALADRPVVLKITPIDGGEHLSLARLQHTNIVPLYSVLADAAKNTRILCMPYFGRATLALIYQSLADAPLQARTGRQIADAIDAIASRVAGVESSSLQPAIEAESSFAGGSTSRPQPPAAMQMLAHVSYVQAMCWITASLADALQFAHERGLVHLDLKPSNVLLATDGQPMLLDFHLAREPIRPVGPVPEYFGGTPDYMAPEQHAAMLSLRDGEPVEVTVDGRADIYSLGAMLYESLGGQLPFADDSPPLERLNPRVSAGLSDIVAKSVARRAEDRYPDAAAFADDLRRHLADQPLVGVPNRSVAERWHKWRRRRPNQFRAAGMLLVVATAAAIVLAGARSQIRDRRHQAERALRDGDAQIQNGDYAAAARTFERGITLVDGLWTQQELPQQLREQLDTAKRLHLAQQLHDLADEVRVLYGTESTPPARRQSLASQCREFWEKRQLIVQSLTVTRSVSDGLQDAGPRSRFGLVSDVSADLQDIAIFAAWLQVKSSDGEELEPARREALRLLDEAHAMFGPSAVLEHERQIHRAALGLDQETGPLISGPASPAPRTAREHTALGRSFLTSGDLARAAEQLAAAIVLDPAGRWPNFYSGLCAYHQRRYEDAVAAFSVCIGVSPRVAGCFYNRALAYAALGRIDEAMHDYDHALELDPTHAAAALNRGMLRFERKHFDQAIADLRLALELGADPATVHYDLAVVHLAANELTAARDNIHRALQHDPAHELARQLRDSLRQVSDAANTGR
jgi:serine/threonine protein kinase/Tfp pilus assembly protein PilF